MTLRHKSLVLAFLVSALSAHAGIRVVLGGGGYAEMLTLTTFNNMPRLLLPYLQEPLKSTLTVEETVLVAAALGPKHRTNIDNVEIEFQDFVPQTTEFLSATRARVSRTALYDADGKPKDFGAIAAVAFRTWVSAPTFELVAEGFQQESVERFAARLEQNAAVQFNVQSIEFKSPAVKFHAAAIHSQLFAEFADRTVDVSAVVLEATECAERNELIRVNNLKIVKGHLKAGVVWRCGQETFKALMNVEVPADLKSESALSQLKPALYSKMPTAHDDCLRILK